MGRFTKQLILKDPEATDALAKKMASMLTAGDVILLSGEVGAGKTHFARALIQARLAKTGAPEDVPSPTYTIVQTYWDGIVEIWHADLYRLTNPAEIHELGLTNALENSICLIEWPEILEGTALDDALNIELKSGVLDDQRIAQIECDQTRWKDVIAMIEADHDI